MILKILKSKIGQNAAWLMAGRIIHIVLSFFIGLLTARYLGPSNYGLIHYVAAYGTFFMAFCTLGINSVIVKNFIDYPSEEGETIGTAILLRFISSVCSFITIIGIVFIIDKGETLTLAVAALYSISLVFGIFDTVNYWFQSKLLSKYYAVSTLIAYLAVSIYRIILLILEKDVRWFAVANALDYFVVALLLFYFYRKCNGPKLSFSSRKAKELLSVSCSYILSGMMIAVYGAIDKIMLKRMLDESVVGYYALALSISTMWTFVLSAIIDSMKPPVMEYHNTDTDKYILMNKRMYAIVFYISCLASVVISIIAPLFVTILYGKAYLPAVQPLRIVVWYVAFSYLGVARDAWVVCERKQMYLKYLYFGAAMMNVICNAVLIPRYGANGAALASLLTQISTVVVFPVLIKDFRPNVKLIIESILLRGVLPQKVKE